ncbi:MAG: DUF3500 domain-containing protein [Nannocystaceae bacterium]
MAKNLSNDHDTTPALVAPAPDAGARARLGLRVQVLLVSTVCVAPLAAAVACGSDGLGDTDTDTMGTSATDGDSDTDASASDSGVATTGGETDATTGSGTDSGTDSDTGAQTGTDTGETVDCDGATTNIEVVVCAAEAFLAGLSSDELSAANLPFSDTVSRTKWSNLPGQERPGVQMGALSTDSQARAMTLMTAVLSTAGRTDLDGVRAADDYLGTMGGMGGMGGGQYSADNYYVSVLGTPSTTGDFAVMFGGHHMAFNMTYIAGVGYPIPNHLGVEPKAEFSIDGEAYAPMTGEGAALLAVFASFDSAALSEGFLAGQNFSDVLIGPVEYGTGSVDAAQAKYPTGDNRSGVLVSSMTSDQQALVTAAIAEWVEDADPEVAAELMATYTSAEAFADTYVAWGGDEDAGVDPDVNGTYMRIDGPRLWIELSCQNGVVIQGQTHYHSIYRDKQFDYGGSL